MDGLVISPDGRQAIRDSVRDRPESADEAAVLLADRILERGGGKLLKGI